MAIERRINPRLRLRRKLALSIISGGETARSAWSYDISSGGMQLHSEVPIAVGTMIELQLPIPDGSESNGFHRIEARARVVHVILESSSGYYRLGVEFVAFHADGQRRFDHYWDGLLRQQLTRQTPR